MFENRSAEEQMHINYKPDDSWAGDFIPFFWGGEYHLFYLKDDRDVPWTGTPWYHLVTKDFVEFVDYGECLKRESLADPDTFIFTGSVLHAEDKFHIFYTGHNPEFRKAGKPEQVVMHAVSDDLYSWAKIPGEIYAAPPDRFEIHDWRDPFVFWNDEVGEYWMLLASRIKEGPSRRRGCTSLSVSQDLTHWEAKGLFYAPDLYYTHECPDLFQIGEWWYLIFSEFSDSFVTRYRMSRSINGPWITPDVDTFDGRAFYAGKTAAGEGRRYIFGWNPTRTEQKDDGDWNWGGNLVVHEVFQNADGTLSVRLPEPIRQSFGKQQRFQFKDGFKTPLPPTNEKINLDAHGTFRCLSAGKLPDTGLIEATAVFTDPTKGLGIMLRTSEDFESSYYVRIEPHRQRLVFDSWPRKGDCPQMVELERPIRVAPGKPVQMTVYVDGSICEIYLDRQVAMSCRMYDLPAGNWGIFVSEGNANYVDIRLFTP
jgi:beta-fructofuranosidase